MTYCKKYLCLIITITYHQMFLAAKYILNHTLVIILQFLCELKLFHNFQGPK